MCTPHPQCAVVPTHQPPPPIPGNQNEEQQLYDTVYKCLCKAHELQVPSIALPVLPGGAPGFPEQLSADTFFKAAQDFADSVDVASAVTAIHFTNSDRSTAEVPPVHECGRPTGALPPRDTLNAPPPPPTPPPPPLPSPLGPVVQPHVSCAERIGP